MFNFKELKLNKEVNESDPFVGIRRSKSGEMEFRLPRGFANFPENDFNETKTLFFRMYRTFKKFERDHSGRYIDKNQGRRDNIEKSHDGYSFLDSEGSEVILYSKISVIENLLEAYEDLSLDVIERQIGIDEKIDYSKIDKYLDKAIYQEENIDEYVIYIDSMELPRNVIQYKSATLIDMFCFILHEVNNELDQGTDSRVRELSSKFKEERLSCDQSLFQEDTFEETIITLKDLLQNIDKSTAYKDNDYWRLYEAVESFLYGELDMNNPRSDGVFWGISNFYQIWEDMCNVYIISNDYEILYISKNVKNINKDLQDQFYLNFRKKKIYLEPDIIYSSVERSLPSFIRMESKKYNRGFRINTVDNKAEFHSYPIDRYIDFKCRISRVVESVFLTDWKYLDLLFLSNKSKKLERDIAKQLCYEYCFQHHSSKDKLHNQFVIPFFYGSKKNEQDDYYFGEKVYEKSFNQSLKESKIEVFKADFYTMQDAYLNYDQ